MTETALQTSFTDPDVAAAMQVYERIKPLQDVLGLKDLTIPEMQLFAMVAQHTGLDPFTRQIYAIKRGGKVTHQTGIDGYRSSAERTGQYAGSDEATYEVCGCGDEGSPKDHPSLARVVVHRILTNGHVVDQVGLARWHEVKPEHKKPANAYDFLDAMWWRMPWNQLAKCAEANGLRKAFPRVLGGVYIAEEMEQDRTIEGQVAPPKVTLAERAAEKAAAVAAVEHVEAKIIDLPETPPLQATDRPDGILNVEEVVEGAPVVRSGLSAQEFTDAARHGGVLRGAVAKAIGCTGAELDARVAAMTHAERGVLADELNLDWRSA